MSFFSQGCVGIFNTQSRVDELTKKLGQLTSSQMLFVPNAQGFRRKMKFASGQDFGGTFNLGLQALGGHIANGRVAGHRYQQDLELAPPNAGTLQA